MVATKHAKGSACSDVHNGNTNTEFPDFNALCDQVKARTQKSGFENYYEEVCGSERNNCVLF